MKQETHWWWGLAFAVASVAALLWVLYVTITDPQPRPMRLFLTAALLGVNGICLIILLGVRRRGQ